MPYRFESQALGKLFHGRSIRRVWKGVQIEKLGLAIRRKDVSRTELGSSTFGGGRLTGQQKALEALLLRSIVDQD
jgi:hypothetical protein